tara:strand:- start:248 stop:1372 length:1125 start_codon:yes stop_codon:yes gene_type:complete
MSDIQFSGDARFRPRYDIKENGDGSSTSDLYYMYRARLNMKADIGDGWFFNTQLGAANTAGMTTMGVDEDITAWGPGNQNSNRPPVNFMQLYFGSMKDDWGFWAGAFPLKYNPSLDLHFYSDKLVDIPFALFNNSSTTGFAGYKSMYGYKLNWFLSVDNNVVENEETLAETIVTEIPGECSDPSFLTQEACEDFGAEWTEGTTNEEMIDSETIDDCDDFTLGFDANLIFGSVSVTPRLLTSFGGIDDDIFPTTLGVDILLPEMVGFKTGFSYYTSIKGSEGDDGYYEADHMRLSLSRPIKEGKLKFFYDIASKDDDKVSFIWLSYTHTCYKGDMGEVTLSPTFRLQNGKGAGTDIFDENYSRSKFEVTAQIKFK